MHEWVRERHPDWLYYTDIGDGPDSPPTRLRIRGVEEIECGGRLGVGLRFRFRDRAGLSTSKALVLNKTNLDQMVAGYGRNTDYWIGEVVELYTVPDSGHGFGPGIRTRRPEGAL